MIRVKICGITNLSDALEAIEAGADALGFIFYRSSPRYIAPEVLQQWVVQLPPFVTKVGVFVNEERDNINRICENCQLGVVQLHGQESPRFCQQVSKPVIKALRLRKEEDLLALKAYKTDTVSGLLLDSFSEHTPGGTGRVFNWDLAKQAKQYGRIILAGGLTPKNVSEAVAQVKPYGVDVCSGVESRPGKKDKTKLEQFIRAAKGFYPAGG
jgi:phosphoribosylanthranilate isomerase